jgi:hypothetical protein
MNDLIDLFKDTFKSRFANPFFSAYALVWIVRHWELIYAAIAFEDAKVAEKISYLKQLHTETMFVDILYNIGITFLVLTASYVFLAIARYLSIRFEFQLIPWIYSLVPNDKYIPFDKFQVQKELNKFLEEQLDEAVRRRKQISQENEDLENRNHQLREEIGVLKGRKIGEALDKDEVVSSDSVDLNKFKSVEILLDSLEASQINKIQEAIISVRRGGSFNYNDENINTMLKYNLVELDHRQGASYYYKLTEFGNQFNEYVNFYQ